MGQRLQGLQRWLSDELALGSVELAPASADASFRRYFRFRHGEETLIAVDAPPETENSVAYVAIAGLLGELGLNVPRVIEADLVRGYMLVSDLGTATYLQHLDLDSADRLYRDAIDALITLQASAPVDRGLPEYDRPMLLRELGIFREWYLGAHCGIELADGPASALAETEQLLTESALEQPRVFVHRDYHSRNLMLTGLNNPGILDFQDAVTGPLTYDPVSLLRDCYIAWPAGQVRDWALAYRQLALHNGVLREQDPQRFERWFDWMGMQRHLKAIGIFARLSRRDDKHGYLADIPRTLNYVVEVAGRYPELREFARWLRLDVLPKQVARA